LTPIIEKAVREAGGRVKLVKLNIDDHPAIPGQMGIQSIPAVVAFSGGKPVDGFMGAVPESQMREFIDKVAGPPAASPAEAQIEAVLEPIARGYGGWQCGAGGSGICSHFADAVRSCRRRRRSCGLHDGNGRPGSRRADAGRDRPGGCKDPEVASVIKRLEMAREVAQLGDPVELEARLAKNPA
jgi:putative thioredoxin